MPRSDGNEAANSSDEPSVTTLIDIDLTLDDIPSLTKVIERDLLTAEKGLKDIRVLELRSRGVPLTIVGLGDIHSVVEQHELVISCLMLELIAVLLAELH